MCTSKMDDIVIVGAARTPIGDLMGSFKDIPPVDLGILATNAALERAGVKPEQVMEVACGLAIKAGNGGNPGRQIQLKTGMPIESYACTVDQQCSSSMKAFEILTQSIMLGKTEIGVAVGAECMSRAPHLLLNSRGGYRMGDSKIVDGMLEAGLVCALEHYHMGVTAENLAEKYGITREEQDHFAVLDHTRAKAARDGGKFDDEIVPVTIKTKKGEVVVSKDEHIRDDASFEVMSKLAPAFKKDGTVTAGNASGCNDAAAALVVTTASKAKELGLKPMARLVCTANMGVEPKYMGIGPAYVIPKALEMAGLTKDDIGYYEINVAFAAQFLACNRILELDMDKVNANGSGIALGHPVGCTGARLLVSLIYEMKRRQVKYGLASMCVGGGPAMATILELCD